MQPNDGFVRAQVSVYLHYFVITDFVSAQMAFCLHDFVMQLNAGLLANTRHFVCIIL